MYPFHDHATGYSLVPMEMKPKLIFRFLPTTEAEVIDVKVKIVNASMLNISWTVLSYGLNISHFTIYYQTVSSRRVHTHSPFLVDAPGTTSFLVEVAEHIPDLEHQFQVSASTWVDEGQVEGEKSPLTENSRVIFGNYHNIICLFWRWVKFHVFRVDVKHTRYV